MATETPVDRETVAAEQAKRDFADHDMTVRLDDGVHRHLRFAQPGEHSWCMWFDVVTWPGFLFVGGDIESFVFARTEDMLLDFFGGPGINAHYWSEKLQAPRGRSSVQVYSEAAVETAVKERLRDYGESWNEDDASWANRGLAAWREHVAYVDLAHEDTARNKLDSFKFDGYEPFACSAWEVDLWEWSHHFLISCWAIRRAQTAYLAARELSGVRGGGHE